MDVIIDNKIDYIKFYEKKFSKFKSKVFYKLIFELWIFLSE